MNIAIAILGLALLVLVHEAGHFFVARAVGMSPRKFYIGFPPALVKTTRNGIEYGIGAIPLGGYVKIPGIHRPAASDLDLHFGRALGEVPELVTPLERVKRPLLVFDIERTRELLPELEQATSEAELSPAARKSADRALVDLHDGLSADAYWRAKTWKRIAVIAAGPGTNVLLAVILFAVLYSFGGGKVTARVDQVLPGHPAAQVGLRHGDTIVSIDGAAGKPTEIARRISGSKGRPLSLVVERNGSRVALGPVLPKKDQAAYLLCFVLRGTGLSPPAATWASLQLTWAVTTGTV
ncbi:MAG: site-2 protease family protein, partial [Gaiellaceae bacterium]